MSDTAKPIVEGGSGQQSDTAQLEAQQAKVHGDLTAVASTLEKVHERLSASPLEKVHERLSKVGPKLN